MQHEGGVRLFRDGVLLGEEHLGALARFELPPERARYRLEVSAEQAWLELSTRVSAAWTFESANVASDREQRLPLLSVRFDPDLGAGGRAPSGVPFRLPITTARYDRDGAAALSALELQVSYDDGASWEQAPVEHRHGTWAAQLRHPRSAAYVSLRANARDLDGNELEQTVLRAYALGRD